MIMFFLPWWVYVLIGTVAFASSLAGQWLANLAQLGIDQPDDGPFPCFAHLGTDDDGAEDWCGQLAGHEGDCLGMRQEWMPENGSCGECGRSIGHKMDCSRGRIAGPVTLHNDPATGHNDWEAHRCPDTVPDGRCQLVRAHIGLHEYI